MVSLPSSTAFLFIMDFLDFKKFRQLMLSKSSSKGTKLFFTHCLMSILEFEQTKKFDLIFHSRSDTNSSISFTVIDIIAPFL